MSRVLITAAWYGWCRGCRRRFDRGTRVYLDTATKERFHMACALGERELHQIP